MAGDGQANHPTTDDADVALILNGIGRIGKIDEHRSGAAGRLLLLAQQGFNSASAGLKPFEQGRIAADVSGVAAGKHHASRCIFD
jgi:hypothetical protein